MIIGAPVIGNEITIGCTTYLRLRNGELWIELDDFNDDGRIYVYEVLDTRYLEDEYRACLTEQAE